MSENVDATAIMLLTKLASLRRREVTQREEITKATFDLSVIEHEIKQTEDALQGLVLDVAGVYRPTPKDPLAQREPPDITFTGFTK